ncbi:MAG: small GTP-binding protein [Frankiales bacterium]|nr:small GTP-binding protein [Frankiales bacterium]
MSKAAKQAGPAPEPRAAELVRNVVVVGHAGAGKTTLVEALLTRTGAIGRAGTVADGSTVSDSEDVEVRLQRSVALALAPLEHAGIKVNLLDTPGSADFVGELRAGLRAADAALFVISAVDGVDALTVQLWHECAAVGMPRCVVITQLDKPRADFDDAVAICQRVLGEGVHPLYLPMHGDAADEPVAGVIGLISQRVYDWSSGERVERDPDPQHLPLIETLRGDLIEAVIAESEDETLLDRYLAGEAIDPKVITADLELAVARGSFYPVIPAAPLSLLGTDELLEVLTQAMPTPLEHPCPVVTRPDGSPASPVSCDPSGPLVAEVVKTTSDPYLGRVSLIRVFSGTLRPDAVVHVSGHGLVDRGHPDHDAVERVGALSCPLGALMRPVAECGAGDIVAVAKLSSAETGDTISAKDDPLLVHPWELPEPQHVVAIEASSRGDEDKLGTALQRLVAEDPTLRLERQTETGQLLLWTVGEAHADVLVDRLQTRYGVSVTRPDVLVALRETLCGPVSVTGRHVKQSGGHGQFAVVHVDFSPGPAGSGLVFESRVVGGTVPTSYVPSVEKGIAAQMSQGTRPIVDVLAVLTDGKAHSVDSSDAAFQSAGALALREACAAAGVQVLEPVSSIEVRLPAGYVGTAMSDLSSRRARVTGNVIDDDVAVVSAEVPDLELLRYAAELRALSHGTGSFTRQYLRHEPLPPHLHP